MSYNVKDKQKGVDAQAVIGKKAPGLIAVSDDIEAQKHREKLGEYLSDARVKHSERRYRVLQAISLSSKDFPHDPHNQSEEKTVKQLVKEAMDARK